MDPLLAMLIAPQMPRAEVRDVLSSTADLTTYTFTNANLGDLGGTLSFSESGQDQGPNIRAGSRKIILAIVHGEAAAAAFSVSTCTIGGVSPVAKRSDNSGVNGVVDTAIFEFETRALEASVNNNVVVTFSKAVTSCVVGIIAVSNIGMQSFYRANNASGTGNMLIGMDTTVLQTQLFPFMVVGTTCTTPTETMNLGILQIVPTPGTPPMLLYEANNGEIAYGAAWVYCPQYIGDHTHAGGMEIDWSGATFADLVGVCYL